MDQLSRIMLPIHPRFIEGGSRIGYYKSLETQVARHSCRGGDTVIGSQTGNDQFPDPGPNQPRLQIGSDKSAVHLFPKNNLAHSRSHNILESISGIRHMKRRNQHRRTVLYMTHRESALPPKPKQFTTASLGVGIIPLPSPIGNVAKSFLDVYQ